MSERIGLIGLGIMGRPIARNLLKAGFALTVTNRSQPPIEQLVAEGATGAANGREVAERSDIVITIVPDSPDVAAVLRGPDGVFAGAHTGLMIVDMSTISPVVARQLAEEATQHGIQMLDAPVSGGDKGAIAGTLSIMAGGDAAAFERALPVFQALGTTITHCGASGAGQTVKACNQIAVAINYAAVAEALILGTRAGIDPAIIIKVLSGGLAQSRVMEMRGASMAAHTFEPGFKVKLHSKDLRTVSETARTYQTALPFTALVDQLYTGLMAQGHGDLDHSALLMILEQLSGDSPPPA